MTFAPLTCRAESWMPIEGYPAYLVSDQGRVKRIGIINGGQGSVRHPTGYLSQRAGHTRKVWGHIS